MKRPWFNCYDKEVPPALEYPQMLIPQILANAAAKFPQRKALIFFGTHITYQELQSAVVRFAQALHLMGIQPMDRVVLFMPNCPQMVIAYYAALSIGAIVVPTNPTYTEKEFEFQINDAQAETIITLDLLFSRVHTVRPRTQVKRVIVGKIQDYLPPLKRILYPMAGQKGTDGLKIHETDGVFFFQNLLKKEAAQAPHPAVTPSDTAILQYTGGTTGVSKAAMLSHDNIVRNTLQMRQWYFDIKEGTETVIAVLPFFHTYGMAVSMNLPLSIGSTLILFPRFVPKDILKAIQHHRATLLPGIPGIYATLNTYKGIKKFDISTIRYCISGAAPLPVKTLQDFEERTGGVIIEGYGLSEASPVTHCNPLLGARKIGSIGLPLSDTDCKIVDIETGDEVPPGREGELCIKGPQVMQGYWHRSDETAHTIRDGWLFTGDIARMDEQGYFYIVERKKDMIISEGFNIYPRELDEFLMTHPKIQEAAVIGVPDTLRGEKVLAYVVLKQGQTATQEEITKFCREGLAKYKVPKKIIFKAELPKSLAGKTLRRVLRAEAPVTD